MTQCETVLAVLREHGRLHRVQVSELSDLKQGPTDAVLSALMKRGQIQRYDGAIYGPLMNDEPEAQEDATLTIALTPAPTANAPEPAAAPSRTMADLAAKVAARVPADVPVFRANAKTVSRETISTPADAPSHLVLKMDELVIEVHGPYATVRRLIEQLPGLLS